jgi:hypothetical protein
LVDAGSNTWRPRLSRIRVGQDAYDLVVARSGWRRRSGTFYRPTVVPWAPWRINDGGDDAPLTARGRLVFWLGIALVFAVGIGLIVLTRVG